MNEYVKEVMESHGYDSLKNTQKKAFENNILDDKNDLLIAETGNGKTLCAESVSNKVLSEGGSVAYLVPSRQLVRDKREEIKEWYGDTVSSRGYNSGITVTTFESFYQSILREINGATNVDLVVLDDFHEIYSSYRGPGIEKAISTIKKNNIEIFAMSATIGNPEEIANWLDADLTVSTEGRQIEIEEEFIERKEELSKSEQIAEIVEDHSKISPFLVFNSTRKNSEARARKISEELDLGKDKDYKKKLENLINDDLTPKLQKLAEMLNSGVAYHHAGLPRKIKQFIEELFENKEIEVICSTTTIAYGFDAPVQTVIVADLKRYNFEAQRMTYVGVWEFVQWIGRAARPGRGYDKGYSLILSNNKHQAKNKYSKQNRKLEPVESHLQSEKLFRKYILELIVMNWNRADEIESFVQNTLYATQINSSGSWGREFGLQEDIVEDKLRKTANWLEQNNFINESVTFNGFEPTNFGESTIEFSFDISRDYNLSRISKYYNYLKNNNENERELLYKTLDVFNVSITKGKAKDNLINKIREENYPRNDEYGRTACIIIEYWMKNEEIAQIEEETGIETTMLSNISRSASSILEASENFYSSFPNKTKPKGFQTFYKRIKYGVRRSELSLVENVRGIGRNRVRSYSNFIEENKSKYNLKEDKNLIENSKIFVEEVNDPKKEIESNLDGFGSKLSENIISFIRKVSDNNYKETNIDNEQSESKNKNTTLDDF